MNDLYGKRVGCAMTGSFCTFKAVFDAWRALKCTGAELTPILSFNAARNDTRFCTSREVAETLAEIAGVRPLTTLAQVEPIGPKKLLDALVIAPCTGNTLAKLAAGIADTPVTLVANTSDVAKWTKQNLNEVQYDESLLAYLKEVPQNQDNFVVVHLIGSHFNFENRYPPAFTKFGEPGKYDLIPNYENTVAYTDHILQSIHDYCQEHGYPAGPTADQIKDSVLTKIRLSEAGVAVFIRSRGSTACIVTTVSVSCANGWSPPCTIFRFVSNGVFHRSTNKLIISQ